MSGIIASTSAGRVQGTRSDGIAVFKGVPYAAPPTGDRRFRPPAPLEPWEGVRDALSLPPSCPQPSARPQGWPQEPSLDEDCLYLNVWTPGVDDGGARPVMVWIHGGGYAIGSGSWPLYDGERLARRGDAVIVSLNHRLGPLGFLHLASIAGEEFASSGNNGMLDLVAALEWVRDEITHFGGDPANVTVFGESGGGAKISTLLAMPAARGLFHRAVVQSGPALRVTSERRAEKAARGLLEELDIDEANLSALWDLPAEALVATTGGGLSRMGFTPVLDGEVVPRHPGDALADGTAADVPLLVGCNRDEGAGQLPRDLDDAGLRERLTVYGADHVEEIITTYRDVFPDASPLDLYSYVLTDSRMRYGSIRMAELHSTGTTSPTFLYLFCCELAGRAGHGYEIAYHMDNLGQTATQPSASRQALADAMSDAWLAFARTGDPNHAGLPDWPTFDLDRRATMYLDRPECVVHDDPESPTRELWARLLDRPKSAPAATKAATA